MHIAYGCFLRWVIPFYHGFQYQTGQNLNDLGYPWNLQYRSEWWKKHLQLAGSVAALILWHRQIYTSQWHPETPGFCANKETLIGGVIRQNFRCVDHRHLLWGKKNKKNLLQIANFGWLGTHWGPPKIIGKSQTGWNHSLWTFSSWSVSLLSLPASSFNLKAFQSL